MGATAPPQHLAALAKANAVRLGRANLKRRIAAREVTLLEVLSPDHAPGVRRLEPVAELVRTLPIGELLTWPPRWGVKRMQTLLAAVDVGEHLELGQLTDRRRWAIIAELTGQTDPFRAPPPRPTTHDVAAEVVAVVKARRAPRLAPAPEPAPEPVDLSAVPAELRVACPYCRSVVGEACSTYDPIYDRWDAPPTHRDRLAAAGLRS
jgi:hypothetical protein